VAVILDVPTTLPGLFASGAWPSALNTGKWRFEFTPTAASSSYVGGNYHALVGGQPHGNVWLNDKTLEFWNTSDGLLVSQTLSWSAGQTVTVTVDVPTLTLTIAGATTGNGAYSFTSGTYFDISQGLGVGRDYGSSSYPFAGTISDIDDTVTGGSGTGATTLAAATSSGAGALAIAGTASPTLAAATAAGVGAGGSAPITGTGSATLSAATSAGAGALAITGTSALTLDAVTSAATGMHSGSGSGSATLADATAAGVAVTSRSGTGGGTLGTATASGLGALAITGTGGGTLAAATTAGIGGATIQFGPGVNASAIATYGHAVAVENCPGGYLPAGGGGADMDGRTPTAVNSQASGSSFYATRGRPAAITTDIYDNKSNTWTKLHEGNYGPFVPAYASWDAESWVCLDGTGGSNHVVSTACVVTDESHLAWEEIKGGHVLVASSHVQRLTAGTDQTSGSISTSAPAWVYVDWFGVYGIFGAEGFDWTVEAVGENADPALGWQVADSRVKHHTDGWFQWKRWRRYYSVPTSNIQLAINTATLNPAQPAQFFAAAFQNVEGRLATGGGTLDAVTSSGTGELAHAGTGAATLGALTSASTGRLAIQGSAAPTLAAATSTGQGRVAIAGTGGGALEAGELDVIRRGVGAGGSSPSDYAGAGGTARGIASFAAGDKIKLLLRDSTTYSYWSGTILSTNPGASTITLTANPPAPWPTDASTGVVDITYDDWGTPITATQESYAYGGGGNAAEGEIASSGDASRRWAP
jgi:hypothetical protein